MSYAWKFGILALVALALTALPGGGGALRVALTLLSIAFFTAIAYLGYRLYRAVRLRAGLAQRPHAAGALRLDRAGVPHLLRHQPDVRLAAGSASLAWLALLGICSYGVYWVWTQYRAYG